MFRTIDLNARHPQIRGSSEEFRLLMPLDGGVHYRFLLGPAASSERAPKVGPEDRLYPVVTWGRRTEGIEITDPAWPGSVDLLPREAELLRRCDGGRPLGGILETLHDSPAGIAAGIETAQRLVDEGVLCPLGHCS